MAAPSTYKRDMSVADWAIVNQWSVDMLHKAEKKWLCKIGCFCGGFDPASALVSWRLYANADFIVSRCNSVLGDRWLGNVLTRFREGWPWSRPEYDNEEKTSGYLVWNGIPSKSKVRIPDGFCVAGVGVSLLNSHCEDSSALKGLISDPSRATSRRWTYSCRPGTGRNRFPRLRWCQRVTPCLARHT